ncbi:unnamed protein product [Vitrella brassicaformis CCMP3155]|uniref:GAF domain-containing protein n=4 Tax=Vitrella brassicaformis TaxID=1169539 RepID=A0A0G4EFV5_VITBC|nr:unnamed protein product [Vitrella brassicaformis CCMP3155]|eukprot:CEL94265.1 unnamed protein product [Vitrella brassicaformis CCMP3155]
MLEFEENYRRISTLFDGLEQEIARLHALRQQHIGEGEGEGDEQGGVLMLVDFMRHRLRKLKYQLDGPSPQLLAEGGHADAHGSFPATATHSQPSSGTQTKKLPRYEKQSMPKPLTDLHRERGQQAIGKQQQQATHTHAVPAIEEGRGVVAGMVQQRVTPGGAGARAPSSGHSSRSRLMQGVIGGGLEGPEGGEADTGQPAVEDIIHGLLTVSPHLSLPATLEVSEGVLRRLVQQALAAAYKSSGASDDTMSLRSADQGQEIEWGVAVRVFCYDPLLDTLSGIDNEGGSLETISLAVHEDGGKSPPLLGDLPSVRSCLRGGEVVQKVVTVRQTPASAPQTQTQGQADTSCGSEAGTCTYTTGAGSDDREREREREGEEVTYQLLVFYRLESRCGEACGICQIMLTPPSVTHTGGGGVEGDMSSSATTDAMEIPWRPSFDAQLACLLTQIGLMVERSVEYHKVERREEEVGELYHILMPLFSTLQNRARLISLATDTAQRLLNVEAVIIFLVDFNRDIMWTYKDGHERSWPLRDSDNPAAHVAIAGRPVILHNSPPRPPHQQQQQQQQQQPPSASSRFKMEFLENYHVESALFLPIFQPDWDDTSLGKKDEAKGGGTVTPNQRQQVIGVMAALNSHKGTFSPRTQSLASEFGRLSGMAIHLASDWAKQADWVTSVGHHRDALLVDKRGAEKVKERSHQLIQLFAEVSDCIDPRTTLHRFVTSCRSAMGVADCSFVTLSKGMLLAETAVEADVGALGECVRTGQPVHVENLLEDPRIFADSDLPSSLDPEELMDLLYVPLFSSVAANDPNDQQPQPPQHQHQQHQEHVVGVLRLAATVPGVFDDVYVNSVTTSVRLLQHICDRGQRLEQLAAMFEHREVSSALTFRELFRVVTSKAKSILRCSRTYLLLADESLGVLWSLVGAHHESRIEVTLDSKSIEGQVFLLGATVKDSVQQKACLDRVLGYKPSNVMAVPLKFPGGRAIHHPPSPSSPATDKDAHERPSSSRVAHEARRGPSRETAGATKTTTKTRAKDGWPTSIGHSRVLGVLLAVDKVGAQAFDQLDELHLASLATPTACVSAHLLEQQRAKQETRQLHLVVTIIETLMRCQRLQQFLLEGGALLARLAGCWAADVLLLNDTCTHLLGVRQGTCANLTLDGLKRLERQQRQHEGGGGGGNVGGQEGDRAIIQVLTVSDHPYLAETLNGAVTFPQNTYVQGPLSPSSPGGTHAHPRTRSQSRRSAARVGSVFKRRRASSRASSVGGPQGEGTSSTAPSLCVSCCVPVKGTGGRTVGVIRLMDGQPRQRPERLPVATIQRLAVTLAELISWLRRLSSPVGSYINLMATIPQQHQQGSAAPPSMQPAIPSLADSQQQQRRGPLLVEAPRINRLIVVARADGRLERFSGSVRGVLGRSDSILRGVPCWEWLLENDVWTRLMRKMFFGSPDVTGPPSAATAAAAAAAVGAADELSPPSGLYHFSQQKIMTYANTNSNGEGREGADGGGGGAARNVPCAHYVQNFHWLVKGRHVYSGNLSVAPYLDWVKGSAWVFIMLTDIRPLAGSVVVPLPIGTSSPDSRQAKVAAPRGERKSIGALPLLPASSSADDEKVAENLFLLTCWPQKVLIEPAPHGSWGRTDIAGGSRLREVGSGGLGEDFAFGSVLMKVLEGIVRAGGEVYAVEQKAVYGLFWNHIDCLTAGCLIDQQVGPQVLEMGYDLLVCAMHVRLLHPVVAAPSPFLLSRLRPAAARDHLRQSVRALTSQTGADRPASRLAKLTEMITSAQQRRGSQVSEVGTHDHQPPSGGDPSPAPTPRADNSTHTHPAAAAGAAGAGTNGPSLSVGEVQVPLVIPTAVHTAVKDFASRALLYPFRGFFVLAFPADLDHDFVTSPIENVHMVDTSAGCWEGDKAEEGEGGGGAAPVRPMTVMNVHGRVGDLPPSMVERLGRYHVAYQAYLHGGNLLNTIQELEALIEDGIDDDVFTLLLVPQLTLLLKRSLYLFMAGPPSACGHPAQAATGAEADGSWDEGSEATPTPRTSRQQRAHARSEEREAGGPQAMERWNGVWEGAEPTIGQLRSMASSTHSSSGWGSRHKGASAWQVSTEGWEPWVRELLQTTLLILQTVETAADHNNMLLM